MSDAGIEHTSEARARRAEAVASRGIDMSDLQHMRTERLRLDIPTIDDLPELSAIYADPRTWAHAPDDVQSTDATLVMLAGWLDGWESDGLGPWIVRSLDDDAVLGNAGCWLRPGGWWNLGYGVAPDIRREGVATEAARPALTAAAEVAPDSPVIAFLLEHNVASKRVAENLGMTLQYRGPDEGHPDPAAIRLVYADRKLTPEQLSARLG